MARERRIYRRKRPVRTFLLAVGAVVLAFIICLVLMFFSFQKYLVYSSDGVHMEVPWLEEPSE